MGSSDPIPVAVALGSNLGDREGHLLDAIVALSPIIRELSVSGFHDTTPVGVGPQPRFLNAAVTGFTTLVAPELLHALLDIEARLGRTRPFPGSPRTIDLDLLLYGDSVISTPELTVPHPRFREREFVLLPLAEVAGGWVDPVSGRTVTELLSVVRHDRGAAR